jgi:hypothetical protein
MHKTRILADAPPGHPLHSHLEPIVDFLIATGNSLTHPYRWGSNREGYFCHFVRPIDFSALVDSFEFPTTIVLGVGQNVIYCQNTGCTIQTENSP